MKNKSWIFIGVVAVLAIVAVSRYNQRQNAPTPGANPAPTPTPMNGKVRFLSPIEHATAVMHFGDVVVYTDPVGGADKFTGYPSPNIILVTDIHPDHFDTSTLAAIAGSATLVVPQAVYDLLPATLQASAKVMDNGHVITEQGLSIEAVPMYNVAGPSEKFHTKGRGNGYTVQQDAFRVYIAGDTAGTPEMKALKNIDIALVPMNLPYTMSVEEAAAAVLAFKPKQVYPYHYRGPNGLSDVNKFKQLVNQGDSNIEVILLNWYPNN